MAYKPNYPVDVGWEELLAMAAQRPQDVTVALSCYCDLALLALRLLRQLRDSGVYKDTLADKCQDKIQGLTQEIEKYRAMDLRIINRRNERYQKTGDIISEYNLCPTRVNADRMVDALYGLIHHDEEDAETEFWPEEDVKSHTVCGANCVT